MYGTFKAVALSVLTAVHFLLLSTQRAPFFSGDTGLWSFTMALRQALNWISLLETPKISTRSTPRASLSSDDTLFTRSSVSQPPLGVKPAALFSQASPFSR